MHYYENGKLVSTSYAKQPPEDVRHTVVLPKEILDMLAANGYYDCSEGYLSEDQNTYICYARNEANYMKKSLLEFTKAAKAPAFADVDDTDYYAAPVA